MIVDGKSTALRSGKMTIAPSGMFIRGLDLGVSAGSAFMNVSLAE
jgi:hypothetical protein